MRADARKNYTHVLTVAREVLTEQGATASLRDIARKADVGLATLYRHFPSRDALVETLLRTELDVLTDRATELEKEPPSAESLIDWFKDSVRYFQRYRGVTDLMAAAYADPQSALFTSCSRVRAAGNSLLARAQAVGVASNELDEADLFALIAAAGWMSDQPSFNDRADHLIDFIARAMLR